MLLKFTNKLLFSPCDQYTIQAERSCNLLYFAKFNHARYKVLSDMQCAKAEYFSSRVKKSLNIFCTYA